MKKDKALWGSISILVGIVIAILALVRGDMQTWLLLGVFSLWGSWIIVILLLPLYASGKETPAAEIPA